MYHNFISLLDALFIVNGKLYVNWINIQPITLNNYKTRRIYIKTQQLIATLISFLKSNGRQYINFIKN